MWLVIRIVAMVAALLVLSGGAPKGGRVALVIGNGDYQLAGTLANPVNDAEDIAAKLRTIGFEVVDGYNLGKRDLEQKVGEFADALDGAEVGLFYYAGHGIQVDGHNFVVPTDARLDAPAKLRLEAIPIDDILDLMSQQAGTSILILDACRNNPFARSLRKASTTRAVQVAEGLAQFDQARGSFIAFSTAPGSVAMDGTGRNSPFAAALLRHIGQPGQSINDLMIDVRRDVVGETKDFQSPMAWDSLTDRFEFVPATPAAEGEVASAGGEAGDQPAQQQRQVASAEDPARQMTAEIETFLTTRYLKPDAANLAATVERLYTDPATSYGYEMKRADLLAAKQAWFAKWSKWKLNLVPGTLQVTMFDDSSATAKFDLRYRYSPKDAGLSPIAGTSHIVLDLVREGDGWRIEMENSVQ